MMTRRLHISRIGRVASIFDFGAYAGFLTVLSSCSSISRATRPKWPPFLHQLEGCGTFAITCERNRSEPKACLTNHSESLPRQTTGSFASFGEFNRSVSLFTLV